MIRLFLLLSACGKTADAGPPAPVEAPAPPEKLAATEILVAWRGASGAPTTVTRSEAEARALAADLRRRATAGEVFEALARTASDGPAGRRGGSLGVWRPGTLLPDVEAAVLALPVGGISEPVRSPSGWHVLRRDAVVEVSASQVLVRFAGAWRSTATRTRDEARALAEAARKEIEAGAPVAQVAAKYSDDPTGADLGVIAPGQVIPAIEDAAFALAVGQVSGIVETPYGFHVIVRAR